MRFLPKSQKLIPQKLIPHELMPQKIITLGYCHKKTERIRDKYDDFEGRGAAGGCGAYPFLQKKLPWCDTRRVKFFLSENIYFPVSFDFFLATASLISAEKATLLFTSCRKSRNFIG